MTVPQPPDDGLRLWARGLAGDSQAAPAQDSAWLPAATPEAARQVRQHCQAVAARLPPRSNPKPC